jgi:hypothetical protein
MDLAVLSGTNAPGLRLRLGADRPWVAVLAVLTAIELVWWMICWARGIAPAPYLGTYLLLAALALAAALALRTAIAGKAVRPAWPALLSGTALTALGASLFLPLKYAIPAEVPFWLDAPLAAAERSLFSVDPWLLLDRTLGWATPFVDRVYGLWLPVQLVVLFMVMLQPSSAAKSRALIAYALAWFALGVAAAALFSSAGPIFYDRLFGGTRFVALGETLRARGAVMALAESDAMWASLASGRPGFVAGISAVPSLHVAGSLWIYFAARTMAPRLAKAALAYTAFIWIASVQLGWHYVADGLAGVAGMIAVWAAAGALQRRLSTPTSIPVPCDA